MQSALLIDEIFRQILEFISEDGKHTLCAVARSCKAWKDPALDYLWTRLSSVVPLIQLIPGVKLVNGIYILESSTVLPDMTLFHSYACRVKHIRHHRKVRVHHDVLSTLVPEKGTVMHRTLSCLLTAQLSSSTCDALQASLSLSTKLQDLGIDLGFKTRSSRFRDDTFRQYLEQITQVASGLERLSLRGSASKRLNNTVASMRNIRCLSLCLRNTLETETLKAVASFPLLRELDVHAGQFDADGPGDSFQNQGFPSLQKLRIRARTPVIELLLEKLHKDTLHTLRIDAEDPAYPPLSWRHIFGLISSKAANTLRSLTLEHHIEIDDADINSGAITHPHSPTDNTTPQDEVDTQLTVDTLQLLRKIGGIRSLIFDMTLPPNINDDDIETLVDSWPELEHLELGSLATSDTVKRLQRLPLTEASLFTFAKKLPKLHTLVLPINLKAARASTIMINIPIHRQLKRLTVAFPSKIEPLGLARYFQQLFPSLAEVDGLPEQEDDWKDLQAALRKLRLEPYT